MSLWFKKAGSPEDYRPESVVRRSSEVGKSGRFFFVKRSASMSLWFKKAESPKDLGPHSTSNSPTPIIINPKS